MKCVMMELGGYVLVIVVEDVDVVFVVKVVGGVKFCNVG